MDNEFILFDRIHIIQDLVKKYGEDKFYVSFSGGKDSTVLHYLIDEALPNNEIPRVFCNTGIEYEAIVEYVMALQIKDNRIIVLRPSKNIRKVLEEVGYPFKSKEHSHVLSVYQNSGMGKTVKRYLNENRGKFKCPKSLLYQFQKDYPLKVSDKCCKILKKDQFKEWQIRNRRSITITGMMAEEKGLRESMKSCIITDKDGSIIKFHPLLKVSKEWEDWYIKKRKLKLCKLYYPPYMFKRTGCKGCPFSLEIQEQLAIMDLLLPQERKQCEMIWKPVYSEYRRIGYRLYDYENRKLF